MLALQMHDEFYGWAIRIVLTLKSGARYTN